MGRESGNRGWLANGKARAEDEVRCHPSDQNGGRPAGSRTINAPSSRGSSEGEEGRGGSDLAYVRSWGAVGHPAALSKQIRFWM
jgi:hypothetical protein